MAGLWTWLAKPENQRVLTLLGGGVGAIAAAVWAVFTYVHPKPEANPPAPAPIVVAAPQGPSADPQLLKKQQESLNGAVIRETSAINGINREMDAQAASSAPPSDAKR